jgi:predicted nucleic acid-binding protein
MPNRALVVDANILVRAVLGKRVREVMEAHVENVSFFVPEAAYCEAEEHLAALVAKRGGDPEKALALLRSLGRLLELIGDEVYGEFEAEARERLEMRDQEDWPILASALALGCPIWTEDRDFFGCGVATWTSNRVQVFLRETGQHGQPDVREGEDG